MSVTMTPPTLQNQPQCTYTCFTEPMLNKKIGWGSVRITHTTTSNGHHLQVDRPGEELIQITIVYLGGNVQPREKWAVGGNCSCLLDFTVGGCCAWEGLCLADKSLNICLILVKSKFLNLVHHVCHRSICNVSAVQVAAVLTEWVSHLFYSAFTSRANAICACFFCSWWRQSLSCRGVSRSWLCLIVFVTRLRCASVAVKCWELVGALLRCLVHSKRDTGTDGSYTWTTELVFHFEHVSPRYVGSPGSIIVSIMFTCLAQCRSNIVVGNEDHIPWAAMSVFELGGMDASVPVWCCTEFEDWLDRPCGIRYQFSKCNTLVHCVHIKTVSAPLQKNILAAILENGCHSCHGTFQRCPYSKKFS